MASFKTGKWVISQVAYTMVKDIASVAKKVLSRFNPVISSLLVRSFEPFSHRARDGDTGPCMDNGSTHADLTGTAVV